MINNDFEFSLMRQESAAFASGCAESRLLLSRRSMLGLTAALFSTAFAPRIASAGGDADPRLLIILIRGGWDGLNILPDYTDEQKYKKIRGDLALASASQITLTPTGQSDPLYAKYRLNQYMPKFGALFNEGKARIVLPIAPPLRSRSHFDCSFNLENGSPGNAKTGSGWLNRLLQILPTGKGLLTHTTPLQLGNTPTILAGSAPTLAWSPSSFENKFLDRRKPQERHDALDRARLMERLYADDPILANALRKGVEINALADADNVDGSLNKALLGAANLFKSARGPRIAVAVVNGFDSHIDQAKMNLNLLSSFDTALGTFADTMKVVDKPVESKAASASAKTQSSNSAGAGSPATEQVDTSAAWKQTLVLCVSEFGRSVQNNGTTGCDHGIGTVALLFGGAIPNSRIIGTWPTLEPSFLDENKDVKADYDTRDLFKAVLKNHLGIDDMVMTKGSYRNKKLLTDLVFPESATPLPRSQSLANVLS